MLPDFEDLMREAEARLRAAGLEDPRTDVRRLWSHAFPRRYED